MDAWQGEEYAEKVMEDIWIKEIMMGLKLEGSHLKETRMLDGP